MRFQGSPRQLRPLQLIGLSRDSALAVARGAWSRLPETLVHQGAALVVGSLMIGFAVNLLVAADVGLAPYDVLASGVSLRGGITLGQGSWLVAAVLFLVATSLGRRPSLWGIGYIFACGLAVDVTSGLVGPFDGAHIRGAAVVAAIFLMAAGINVVIVSGTSGGPFELLMAAASDRGVSPTVMRYLLDSGVLVGGIVLGGAFGAGTVVYAATMGLTLALLRRLLEAGFARVVVRAKGDLDSGALPAEVA